MLPLYIREYETQLAYLKLLVPCLAFNQFKRNCESGHNYSKYLTKFDKT